MKNWFEQFEGRVFSGQATITQREFEDIQLQAWKAGMRKAVEIGTGTHPDDCLNSIEQYMMNTDTLYPREVV